VFQRKVDSVFSPGAPPSEQQVPSSSSHLCLDQPYVPAPKDEEENNNSDSSDDSSYSPSSLIKEKREKKSKRGGGGGGGGTFANALLRVGTKSTKDCTLDKPVQRKPGRLLETAGRSLLQKSASSAAAAAAAAIGASSVVGGNGFLFANRSLLAKGSGCESVLLSSAAGSSTSNNAAFNSLAYSGNKLSFGLYGGHLPVDHGGYTKSSSTAEEDDEDEDTNAGPSAGAGPASLSREAPTSEHTREENEPPVEKHCPTKRVFSNWGGEFFKKNLDYRANTNKILEKMNLSKEKMLAVPSKGPDVPTSPVFISGERFKNLLGGGTNSATKRQSDSSL
jgi:hypothetical protein